MSVDPSNAQILGVDGLTLDLSKTTRLVDESIMESVGGRALRLKVLRQMLPEIWYGHGVHYLFHEEAFYNPSRPEAYLALSECIAVIKSAWAHYKGHDDSIGYSAKNIKKVFTSNGAAFKGNMFDTLRDHPVLAQYVMANLLSEHAIDAIAIVYTGYTAMLGNCHDLRKTPPPQPP